MLCFALLCLELGNCGNGHFWKTITKGIPWILIYFQSCVITQAMAKETWSPPSLSWLEYRQVYHNVCFLSLNYLSCLTVKPKTNMLVNEIKKDILYVVSTLALVTNWYSHVLMQTNIIDFSLLTTQKNLAVKTVHLESICHGGMRSQVQWPERT